MDNKSVQLEGGLIEMHNEWRMMDQAIASLCFVCGV